jgi:CRP-like cAMP-binding protein
MSELLRPESLEDLIARLSLPGELAAEIERDIIWVPYEKGALIFLPGQPAEVLFWLHSGFVKIYLPRGDGYRTLIGLRKPGEFIGFAAETDESGSYRQVFEAHASTKCTVGMLNGENLQKFLQRINHESLIGLLEELNGAWTTRFLRYAWFIGSSFRVRLEMVLGDLGKGFGIVDQRGTLLMPELTHEDLAEMNGCSRPTVGNLIADLTQEGLLTRGEDRRFKLITKDSKPVTPPAVSVRSDELANVHCAI